MAQDSNANWQPLRGGWVPRDIVLQTRPRNCTLAQFNAINKAQKGDEVRVTVTYNDLNGSGGIIGDQVIWHFIYDDTFVGNTKKWQFLGGSWHYMFIVTDEAVPFTAPGIIKDLATVGPQMKVPFDGDYEFDFGVETYVLTTAGTIQTIPVSGNTTNGYGQIGQISIDDAHHTVAVTADCGASMDAGAVYGQLKYNAASGIQNDIKLMYYNTSGVNNDGKVRERWLRVRPKRCNPTP